MFVDVGLVMASRLAGGVTGGRRTFPAPSSARPGASPEPSCLIAPAAGLGDGSRTAEGAEVTPGPEPGPGSLLPTGRVEAPCRTRQGGGPEARGSRRQARGEGRPSNQKWGGRAGGFCQSFSLRVLCAWQRPFSKVNSFGKGLIHTLPRHPRPILEFTQKLKAKQQPG